MRSRVQIPGLGDSGNCTRALSVLFAEVVTQLGIEPMTTRCLVVALTTKLLGREIPEGVGAAEINPGIKVRLGCDRGAIKVRSGCDQGAIRLRFMMMVY